MTTAQILSGTPSHESAPRDDHARGTGGLPIGGEGLVCTGLSARYRGRRQPAIKDVSFVLPHGSLIAVIGPSGSGKSTLCAAILGDIGRVKGQVLLSGVDLLQSRAQARRLVSFVPQQDALHSELTPLQTLSSTADLRLASEYSAIGRVQRVASVLSRLGLAELANRRIGELSGGQRKRVAVAMELLSAPRLLMLDEPTAGLDEGLDLMMMQLLRGVAAEGRTVLVVTHSTANLNLVDAVLALDAAGTVAYVGNPAQLLEAFETDSYAEVMQDLRAGLRPKSPGSRIRPGGSTRRRRHRRTSLLRRLAPAGFARRQTGTRRADAGADLGVRHATGVLLRRELARMAATPLTVARGVLLLPLLAAVLTAAASDRGLTGSPQAPNAMQGAALSVLVTSTTFFAMALSFGTVVGDRAVIERERRWGVSPVSVLLSKGLAQLGPVVLQSVAALLIYERIRPGPDRVLAGPPAWLVLTGTLALLGVCSMALGLLVSTASRSLERAIFLLMGSIAVLVVLTGLLIPIGHPAGLSGHTLSWLAQFAPTRWGTAGIGAFIGYVPNTAPGGGSAAALSDALWVHDWLHVIVAWFSMLALTALYVLTAAQVIVLQNRRRK